MKTTISVKGMHCASCKALIEDACSDIKGVKSCKVDLKAGKAVVEHDNADLKALKKEIESLGDYKVDV
ncbi:heavy-metal-associated domain-containing protein [Candidatus Woesearchaeota archaeon]|nr:heavy-metal-associated domain-containing protein [Candidatus Woesearchaeota archaeon]